MLWANAVGAAMFGAATVPAATQRRFAGGVAPAAQIFRLAATLPSGGQERLERLRGFGSGFNRALTCACSRIVVGEGASAVLVAAAEPAGPALTLAERVRRLFADRAEPIAVFLPSGTLLYVTAAARTLVSATPTLAGLGFEALAVTAFDSGSATAVARLGDSDFGVAALRLGKDDNGVLALTFAPQASEVPRAAAAPLQAEPAPHQPPAATAVAAASIPQQVPPAVEPPATPEERITDRRHPLRFVWHIDADGRFGVGSDEFAELVGPRTMAVFGRLWSEIAADLKLDPENRVARALATRETWSGIVVSWPVDDTDERLPVELSGLPVFDRDRSFRGYRGFGVCRDIDGTQCLGPGAPRTPDRLRAGAGSPPQPRRHRLPLCHQWQPQRPSRSKPRRRRIARHRPLRSPPPMWCRFGNRPLLKSSRPSPNRPTPSLRKRGPEKIIHRNPNRRRP